MRKLSIGMARIHMEAGEVRDFLPALAASLIEAGAEVFLEHGYGSGMGLTEADYRAAAPQVHFVSQQEVYQQDVVLVLRYPGDAPLRWMGPGACLISMLHYPTRPGRVAYLRSLGIEAVSLDSLKDDLGKRLVENLRAVGWNGVNVAFKVLHEHFPGFGFESPDRNPVKVTVMGAGAVGMFAIQAAVRYGDVAYWHKLAAEGVTGVQVTAVEFDLTNHEAIMTQILKYTDILVDATQRPDTTRPVIPNAWIGLMRPHAVLLDLSVDPYVCGPDGQPQSVKGIEGMPQGNLDQYIFAPDDPAYDAVPACVDTRHRRYAVSCYSWPGIRPVECMEVYGSQIKPMLMAILQVGGVQQIVPDGYYFHRAISRAMLSRWAGG